MRLSETNVTCASSQKSQAANKQNQYFVVMFIVYMMLSLMALHYVKKPEVH